MEGVVNPFSSNVFPTGLERFLKYVKDFEDCCYNPKFFSNMLGVLEACEAFPTDEMQRYNERNELMDELTKIQKFQKKYENQAPNFMTQESMDAFHAWHAAACVLFDKWFYPADEDWMKFQDIEGGGNGYTLKSEYDRIYSSYQKLVARLKDGRELKVLNKQYSTTFPSQNRNGRLDKINIFISYSHADEKWLDRLKIHLKVLTKNTGNINYWEDTKLRGGDKWKEEISKAIENANVAILLVSTHFLASDFITNNELPPILKKAATEKDGTRILPIIVAPCDFERSELKEFQAINDPNRTLEELGENNAAIDRVFLELVKNIRSMM